MTGAWRLSRLVVGRRYLSNPGCSPEAEVAFLLFSRTGRRRILCDGYLFGGRKRVQSRKQDAKMGQRNCGPNEVDAGVVGGEMSQVGAPGGECFAKEFGVTVI